MTDKETQARTLGKMAPEPGIEPKYTVLQAAALPLSYSGFLVLSDKRTLTGLTYSPD